MSPKAAVRLDAAQRLSWLQLIRSENVGPITFRALLNRYGGAEAALAHLPDLARRGGRHIVVASRADAEREMAALDRLGGRFVALGEADYPPALKHVEAAPPLIALHGHGEAMKRPAIAVVGARNASALGRNFTRQLVEGLGAAGYVIVSGLARGIDAAAHEASLVTGTIAVLAGGLDRVYPPENGPLLARIVERGAAVSEMPLGWQAQARDFPRRNRIVAGIALGTVVVEAADRSGSLITARLAGEFGREVFAVPGSPLDPRAAGTNRLIREGATLTTSAQDVIDALVTVTADSVGTRAPMHFRADDIPAVAEDPPAGDRARVVDALGAAPVEIDVLVRETGVSSAVVATVLLELELAGRLARHAGGRVSRLP